jgi:DNA-binding SARP family transcriptional activator
MTTQPITLAPSAEAADKPILIGLLGPLHIMGEPVPSATKLRQSLAFLAMHAGEQVTVVDFIWELWGGKPPRKREQSIQTYVMLLRRIPGVSIVTRPQGYSLMADPFEVDALRFARFAARARREFGAGDILAAEDTLRAAFSLWRGPVLSEVECGPLLTSLREEIEDARRSALDLRFEVDLQAGRHREIIGDLSAAVRNNPGREDTAAMLMLALYRSNRRAEALKVFQQVRSALVAEYGLEPCPALQRLQGQILAGDPSLELNGERS